MVYLIRVRRPRRLLVGVTYGQNIRSRSILVPNFSPLYCCDWLREGSDVRKPFSFYSYLARLLRRLHIFFYFLDREKSDLWENFADATFGERGQQI